MNRAARTLGLLLAVRSRRLYNALFHGARPPRARGARPEILRAAMRIAIAASLLALSVFPVLIGLSEMAGRQRDGAIVQRLEVEPASEGPLDVLRPVRTRWVPEPPARGAVLPESSVRTQHLMLLLLIALLAFTELSSTRVERAPPDLELLAALPLSTAAIFTLRVLDETLLSLMGFIQITPGLVALAWVAGWRLGAVPIGLALTPFLVLPLVQFRTVAEVELRTRLDARRLRNVRALAILAVVVGAMAALGVAVATAGSRFGDLIVQVRDHAAALMWLPPGLVLRVLAADAPHTALGWSVVLAAETVLVLALGGWLIQRRAAAGVDPFTVREVGREARPRTDVALKPRRVFSVMQAKLLTHLARDWSYLASALLVPAAIAIFELALFASLARALSIEVGPYTIAAAGLGTGAWILNTGLLQTMLEERNTLWLLATLPRRLERLVGQLTLAWASAAALPALALTGLAIWLHAPPPGAALVLVVSVVAGTILLALVAGACSLLDATEMAELPQARSATRYQILYMNVALPMVGAVFSGSWWYMQAVLWLDACLAYALIDRIRQRAPYFLDAHAEPPRGITLLDGLVAVHVYFQMQLAGALALIRGLGLDPLAAFCCSSALGGLSTLALARGVAYIRKLDATRELTPWTSARGAAADVWFGLKLGLAAGGAALAVLGAALVWNIGGTAAQLAAIDPRNRAATLALGLFIAPWVEELLFRGLLFSGLRRSAGPRVTIGATAALFALIHPAVSAPSVLILGLAAGWARERTGALAPGVCAHAVFNAVMLAGQL